MNLNLNFSLLDFGIYKAKVTSLKKIRGLVRRLRPIQSSIELIRVGADNDGGYLLPNDLDDILVCFSPGVDVNASFEIDLYHKFNINSHLADFSVMSPPMNFSPLSFTKKFIGAFNNDRFITLNTWVKNEIKHNSSDDLLLQMDIEGSEYQAILSLDEEILKRFRIIIIEFHHVRNWGDKKFFNIIESAFDKLLEHFYVVHIHPNNCTGLVSLRGFQLPGVFEVTFLRKDRTNKLGFRKDFPHVLDSANIKNKKDVTLPRSWYSFDSD